MTEEKFKGRIGINSQEKNNVLVLLSGGIDSTACVHYYTSRGFLVSGIFVDYGQVSAERESKAVDAVGAYYGIHVEKIKVEGNKKWGNGYVAGRNAFLLFTGLMNFKYESGLVSIGIHSGTEYWDCSESFVELVRKCFKDYTGGCIGVDVPLLRWKKDEVWTFCIREGIPVSDTYSCELGRDQPCGRCVSCKDLEALYEIS